ncbi:cytochrome c biogenesis protein CcsA [Thiolapillus sp.]|uniref:cytochrome C assembly family protein n=1 Tax=Thiolapillus sp. TaxID=2017437 RepID=UPI0025DA9FCB
MPSFHPMENTLIMIAAVILYILSGAVFTLRLLKTEKAGRPPKTTGLVLGFSALLLHGYLLYLSLHTMQGVNFSFFNAVSFAAWVIALLYLLAALSKPIESLGVVLLPIAACTLLLDYFFPGVRLLSPDTNWELRAHVISSILAYSVLAMAAVQAVLLAIQDRHLRKHHPGGFIRALPPLQTMEGLMFEMITIGFILLTLALASGFVFLDDMFAQHLVHKTLLSILAWLAFAVLLWGRYRFGWRGRTAIRWTLTGFIVLALAYFGSKAVVELILKR